MILCIICFSLAYFTYHNSSRSIHFFPYMSRFPSNGWIIYVCVCVCVCKILLPYCNIWLANIFSHSIDCFFILLIFFPFLCRSFLDGCNSICLFCFGCHCFWCQTKKKNTAPNTAKTIVNELFSCFFKNLYGFRSYVCIFNPSWVDFCE